MKKKRSFIVHPSYVDAIDELPKECRGECYEALLKYGLNGELPEGISQICKAIMTAIIPTIDSSIKNYEQKVANGKLGGRPPNKEEDKAEDKPDDNKTIDENKPKGNQTETKEKPNTNRTESKAKANENIDKDKDKDRDKDSDKDIYLSDADDASTELVADGSDQSGDDDVFIVFPTTGRKKEFAVTREMVKEYQELYPAADVEQEMRNMRGWCISNPTRQKTHNGVPKFINTWLTKTQNSGGSKPAFVSGDEKYIDPFKEAERMMIEEFGDLYYGRDPNDFSDYQEVF